MADTHYEDPRLAAIYDALNPWAADTDFYLSLAPAQPARILDLGCGTGLLACAYANAGHSVVAVDPAAPMLALAREKPGSSRVSWIQADAQSYRSAQRFDLIVMTGHAFQVLLSDDAVQATLTGMRQHLAPHGRIVFETRNPNMQIWQHWQAEQSRRQITVDGIGTLEIWHELNSVDNELVRFSTHYHFAQDETTLSSTSTLRFLTLETLQDKLNQAGLAIETLYGDWYRAPFRADSPEIIVCAKNSVENG